LLASVTIDLDGLDCYHAIHGLQPPAADPVYDLALRRFLALLDELGAAGTLFVITRYVVHEGSAAENLRRAAAGGHELASHSHTHPYDLGDWGRLAIGAELDAASAVLERLSGRRPVGFRTPGYNVSEAVLDALEARAYRYDSSVFPCPPYYLAKAAVMAGMRLLGRRSGSSLTDPRALLAPLQPYRPRRGRFYRRAASGGRRLWEVPMSVLPGLRVPVIGTTLALFGSHRFALVYDLLRRRQPWLNLEFHGVDFLGADDPGVTPELLARQPDLRVPLAEKLATYRQVLHLVKQDYDYGTLETMVGRLEAGSGG
jgi:peptidoglycan-N-acetylglucosamine deacetylase